MRPPGPLPWICALARSMPCSAAMRRATGVKRSGSSCSWSAGAVGQGDATGASLARGRSAGVVAVPGGGARPGTACSPLATSGGAPGRGATWFGGVGAVGASAAGGAAAAPSPAPTTPRTSPMPTVSPSCLAIDCSTPAPGAATSRLTLSVSSSTSGSPAATWSPSRFFHCPTVPSTIDSPKAGTLISALLADMLHPASLDLRPALAAERRLHDARLLPGVDARRALGGGRPLRAPDVAQRHALGEQRRQPPPDVAPGAHVLGLLLQPDDLGQVGVARQQLLELGPREGVEQLHPRHRDPVDRRRPLGGRQV